MDVYKCCAVCLYIFKLWDNKEVPLLEKNYQGMIKIMYESYKLTGQ